MQFPGYRTRRFKRLRPGRRSMKEIRPDPGNLLQQILVTDRPDRPDRADGGDSSLAAQTPGQAAETAVELARIGVGGVLVSGMVATPDELGSAATRRDGPLATGIKAIKRATRDLLVVADACVCGCTTHGHCGALVRGELHNDESVERIAAVALASARAGADCVLLSARMDGQVDRVRELLDESELEHVAIASVAARFNSTLDSPAAYPLRPRSKGWLVGTHRIDPANGMEAMRQVTMDAQEGADLLAVQPLLTSLDIVFRIQEEAMLPVLAIQSPGEYAMFTGDCGMPAEQLGLEMCVSAMRAGADLVATALAAAVVGLLKEDDGPGDRRPDDRE